MKRRLLYTVDPQGRAWRISTETGEAMPLCGRLATKTGRPCRTVVQRPGDGCATHDPEGWEARKSEVFASLSYRGGVLGPARQGSIPMAIHELRSGSRGSHMRARALIDAKREGGDR